jgi:hypothetical protein
MTGEIEIELFTAILDQIGTVASLDGLAAASCLPSIPESKSCAAVY